MKKIYCLLSIFICLTAAARWDLVRGTAAADKIPGTIKGEGLWQKNFSVSPKKTYLFSVEITSPHEICFYFSPVSMGEKKIAYTTPGKKQKLLGLIACDINTLKAQMEIVLKKGTPGVTVVENMKLVAFDPFKVPLAVKNVSTVTRLDSRSAIILPSDKKLRDILQKTARKISEKLGGIPIVDDLQTCEKDVPILRSEYAGKDLIIVGNLNNNRAFWPAYTRTLAGADAFYPGGNGYELRTAVNVLSNGKNHIIIGGSTPEGLLRGMEKFLLVCSREQKMLLDVQLAGNCLKTVNADMSDWKKNKGKLPGTSPGYDAVRRWYHHALMYYWTGNKFYRAMAKKFFAPVITQKAYTHHYIMEWLILTWEVTKNSNLYTAKEKKAMEELLFANYVELQTGLDVKWQRPLVPPYRNVRINSRHVTAPLWCQLMMSDYLYRNVFLTGEVAELVNYTRNEVMAAVYHIANDRSRPTSDFEKGDNYAELPLAVFRYAFRFNEFGVFKSRQAQKWGNFQHFSNSERDSVLFGKFQRFSMIAAVLGSYYRDPEIKYYEVNSPGGKWSRAMFADRYPNNIGSYNNDLVPALPKKDFKLHLMLLPSFEQGFFPFGEAVKKRYPELKEKSPLIAAVMRNGYKEDFTVFGMTGMNGTTKGISGEVVHLSFRRRNFLNSTWTSVYNHNSGLPLEKNTLHITRSSQGLNEEHTAPQGGFLEWCFDLGGRQGFSCRFTDANGTVWNRAAVMLNPDQIVVHDTLVAEKSDHYNVAIVWRPGGKYILPAAVDTLYTRHGKCLFSINMSGKGFKLKTNTDSYLKKESEKLLSFFSFDGKLAKGESISAASLLQVNKKSKVYDCGNGRVLIFDNGKAVAELRITRAGLVEISRNFLAASNVKEICVGTHKIKVADQPTDVFWGLQKGSCYRSKAGFRRVPAAENKKVREICHAYLDSLKIPADSQKQSERAEVEKKNNYQLLWKNNILKHREVYSSSGKPGQVFDVGRVAEVAYCRSLAVGEVLPPYLEYSVDGKTFKKLVLADPVWQEGVWTHNYGNIALRKQGFQELELPRKIKGRFFRLPGKGRIQLHFSDIAKPLGTPRILETDPFIIVSPEIVKIYPRAYNYDNTLWGALDHSGKTLFIKKNQLAPHEIKFTDFPAKNSVSTAYPDGRLRFYDRAGKEIMVIDTIEELKGFHKKYGRNNTRHPAGGFASTYSLGSWGKPAQLVTARYGQMSFFHGSGQMQGVRAGGVYCVSYMLPRGADFNGDGYDEILAMSCSYLIHCSGKEHASAPLPGTTWPQAFDGVTHRMPSWWSIGYGTWGPKVFALKALPFKGKVRYAAAVSRIFMFVYDAAAKKYAWHCKFPTPVAAADIKAVGTDRWLAVTAGDDSVVTLYQWRTPGEVPQILGKYTFDDELRAVAVSDTGRVFAAGNKGIYEIIKGKAVKHIEGRFTDVKCRGNELLCAAADGTVSAWKER